MLANAITSTPAQTGRRSREDAEQIIRAWHASLPEKEIFTYDKYITDSTTLTDRIADLCSYNKTGVRFLFQAMPGGGKTYFSCCDLVKKINQKTNYSKTVVLAVPNNIQCWQNRQQYGTYAVAGDSDENFRRKQGIESKGYTAVYECVAELATWPATELKNYVLIIDEMHQLMTECDYRAFEGITAAADAVVAAGGVVMCMTATPRQILHLWQFSEWIVAERKDGGKTNVQSIEYISVDTRKQIKVFDAVLEEIRSAKEARRMAVVRLQSKEKIDEAKKTLEAEGISCEVLTADCKDKVKETDGNWYYKSQTYASLIQSGTLPDVDCLLVTSILEVGTSVIGVNRGGTVVQDAGLTPIFVCQRSDTDLDRMLQFFARFRFSIAEAKIFCSKCQTPNEDAEDLTQGADEIMVKKATTLYMQGDRLAASFSQDKFRRLLKSWHGHTDGKGLTEDGKIDMPLIWADAVQRYFGLVYRQQGAAQVIISQEFGVPVTVREINTLEQKSQKQKKVKISDEAKAAFRALMADDSVFKTLASDERDIKKNPVIKQFAETHPEVAKALLKAIKPYADCEAVMPKHVKRDLAIKAAIATAEHPRTPYRDPQEKAVISPAKAMDALYEYILTYPAQVAEQILDAAAGIIDEPKLPIRIRKDAKIIIIHRDVADAVQLEDIWTKDDVNPCEILWANRSFAHEIGGQKYGDYLTMWKIFRLIDTKARFEKFRKITQIFVDSDAETARRARYAYTCVHLNRIAARGMYAEIACPDASYVAAEHQVLTHPERYLYRAKKTDGKLDSRRTCDLRWYQDAADTLTYADRMKKGVFVGKRLTLEQIKTIAEGFGASISKMAGKSGMHGDRYNAEDIFWMIQSAYTVAFVNDHDEVAKNPESFEEFKDLSETGVKMKIRGLRMNAPAWMTCLMPDTTEAELERERVKNILVRRQDETPQPQITLQPMQPMPEPEPEVVVKQEIQTESKSKQNGLTQEVIGKINQYEQLLAQINYNVHRVDGEAHWTITHDTPEQIVESAYQTARGILLDAKIFDADIHETVTRWTYNGGYSRQAFLDILNK